MKDRGSWAPWVTLALLCVVPAALPQDAPFINDEPLLIRNALDANRHGVLASQGLEGTRGLHYSPLPTWLYQGLLLLSHDLRVLVAIRAILTTGLTALALYQLSGALGLWRWFPAIVLLSPYLWFYDRLLWDNTFAIPLCALALSSYARFRETRSGAALRILTACLCALPLIHLMSLALVIPLGLHVLAVERREIWKFKWSVLAILVAYVTVFHSYFAYVLQAPKQTPSGPSPTEAWMFALQGGQPLSAAKLSMFFGERWTQTASPITTGVLDVAVAISLLAFPLVWGGMLLAVARVLAAARAGRALTPVEHLGLVSLAVFVGQTLLNGLTGTFSHPHYYNATWIVFALFAWLTVDTLVRHPLLRWVPIAHGAALALILSYLVVKVHASGGNRTDHYGPTLGNQIQIVKAMSRYADSSPVSSNVLNFLRFPHGLRTLRELEEPVADPARPVARLRVQYKTADPEDGHVELIAD